MNDYIVNVGSKKFNVTLSSDEKISIDGKEHEIRISKFSDYSYLLKVDDNIYQISSEKNGSDSFTFTINGYTYDVSVRTLLEEKAFEFLRNKGDDNHNSIIKSPMPGLILKIKKNVGDTVQLGESLIILEAMKMENDIRASASGVIKEISVKENSAVEKNETLLTIG